MTDLSGRVHTVETTASETKEALADAKGNITTLTKRADGTDTKIADAQGRVQTLESRAGKWDLELSKKVDNATYNAGIQNLGNQINLKANKSDLDGYATKAQLSVESDRITQQASAISSATTIANGANSKIDGLRIGGRNLLKGTSNQFKTISNSGWMWTHTWTNNDNNTAKISLANFHTGDYLTYSAWVINDSDVDVTPEIMFFDKNLGNYTGTRGNVLRPGQSGLVTNTRQIGSNDWYVRPSITSTNGQAGAHQIRIKEEMLTLGNVCLPWQPSDLDLPTTIVSTVTTTTNAKQIVDSSGIYSEVTKLVDTKVGNVTTQLNSYKHTVDDTGDKLRDVMGALKLDSNGNLTSDFNELIKTASGVEERYTQLSGKIDGIVVGGKNLLDGTADFNSTYWYAANGTADIMQINGKTAVRGLKNGEGRRYKGTIKLEPDTDYTVSVYVRVNGKDGSGLNLGFYCNLDGNGDSWGLFNLGTLSTEWKRVSLKWHNNNHREMTIPRVEWSGDFTTGLGSGFTSELQLEKSNKPSDWGMSDNDINKKISDANASIAKTNETIKTVDGNVTTVKNNLDKTKSIVTQLANLFDVTVGDSSISVTNNGVLVKGKQIHIDGQTLIDNASIDGAKIKSLDAGKITTGTLNAANVNVINLNANNIKTGTLTGPGMALDLNNGSFKINNSDNSLKVEMDSGELRFYRQRNTKALTGTISASDWGFLSDNDQSLNLTGQSGAILKTEDFKITSLFVNNGFFLTTTDVPSSDGSAVILHNNNVKIVGQTNSQKIASRISILAGKPYTYKTGPMTNVEYTGIDIIGDENKSGKVSIAGGSDVNISAEKSKVNLYLGFSSISASVADSTNYDDITQKSEIKIYKDSIFFNFKKDKETSTPLALYNGGTLSVKDLSVWGSKNAIVQTTAGWTKINAYETAEYYFGDLGTAVTDDTSTVRIGIEPLFNETVNTEIPYQVFITSYGEGYAWVAERGSNYFVIKSSVPNLEIGYEIKAKRKGYENVRLEIDKHMEVNKQ